MPVADTVLNLINGATDALMAVLPTFSPLESLDGYQADAIVQKGLGWLNWFIPVDVLLKIVAAWATAVVAYNAFKLTMHFYEVTRP